MRRRLLSRRDAGVPVGLTVGALAPMVDMMTLLLVFLLRAFSTDPAPAPPSGTFRHAPARSLDARAPAAEVLVSAEAVWVDGERVAAVRHLPARGVVEEIRRPLAARGAGRPVEVHADRSVPWSVLDRVLDSARAAGATEVALVAAQVDGV